jgi:hypothetical protein
MAIPVTRRTALLGGIAAGLASPLEAAVAILRAGTAPQLLLIDAERLSPALLSRLNAQGIGEELQPVPDCEAVEFGLLTSRMQQAGRILGLLSAANHALVLESLKTLGARVQLDGPAAALGMNAARELLALRDALGAQAVGLLAIVARIGA